MKNQVKVLSLTVATTLMLAVSAFAQQPNNKNDQQMQDMKDMPGMQMKNGEMQNGHKPKDQMMQSCHKNMRTMMDSNAQTTKDIQAAKQSNEPAKMRAALDEAEKALSPMNEHMKNCMSMMKNMQGMGGKMGESDQKTQEKKP